MGRGERERRLRGRRGRGQAADRAASPVRHRGVGGAAVGARGDTVHPGPSRTDLPRLRSRPRPRVRPRADTRSRQRCARLGRRAGDVAGLPRGAARSDAAARLPREHRPRRHARLLLHRRLARRGRRRLRVSPRGKSRRGRDGTWRPDARRRDGQRDGRRGERWRGWRRRWSVGVAPRAPRRPVQLRPRGRRRPPPGCGEATSTLTVTWIHRFIRKCMPRYARRRAPPRPQPAPRPALPQSRADATPPTFRHQRTPPPVNRCVPTLPTHAPSLPGTPPS